MDNMILKIDVIDMVIDKIIESEDSNHNITDKSVIDISYNTMKELGVIVTKGEMRRCYDKYKKAFSRKYERDINECAVKYYFNRTK